MQPGDTHEVRTGNVPNMEAMTKARNATWVMFLAPLTGAVGVVIGGNHTSEIFIENGRFHGKQIVAALTGGKGPSPQS